ncbi:MAG: HEPN domain-containing protein [bacterium]
MSNNYKTQNSFFMNALVEEWIAKAEADYHSALRDYRARKNPNYDGAGFHAQQCIEKYLKGFLLHNEQLSVRLNPFAFFILSSILLL